MDKDSRNAIERATQRARRLLEEDFAAQLEGIFDVNRTGVVATNAGPHLDPRQAFQRERIVAAIEHKRAAGMNAADAVADYLRGAAFTALNRFVALKMLEARELLQECITKGEQSAGYREFCGLAPGVALLPDSAGYRLYIECLFDEISVGLKVLFNRRDAASVLWPRRACFEDVLGTLNVPDLATVWGEDETIGWVYQYYNSNAERKAMREESSAPRNSRELAIRNQFFTPRYVVEFLGDNTLGRLWYEMTRGSTALRTRCRFLVRRPIELFLKPGEPAPQSAAGRQPKAGGSLSQEELLRRPDHIPYRPLKDPREIRLLDPACGSMHFGLYAFDLFTVIYDEAWEIAQVSGAEAMGPESLAPFVDFARTFSDKAAFLREVPLLILEHNIHGIDIDPRAVQIAGLSLWLRAQRAWHQAGVKQADRPRITRSNLVCAEPMPGEKQLLREFVEHQFPAGERPAFTLLLETIFDRMKFADEAGPLLRIEEEIRTAIADAKRLWMEGLKGEQASLFAEPGEKAGQSRVRRDLSGITDEQFWGQAEHRIYGALQAYAEQAENGGGFQRRLFAGDAAQGFAFIDLCRKRYDVAVMNPPFGEFSTRWRKRAADAFPDTRNDIFAAFTERMLQMLVPRGSVGAITSRAGLFLTSFDRWRRNILRGSAHLRCLVDLGEGVMDNAMVEAAAYCFDKSESQGRAVFIRALLAAKREAAIGEAIGGMADGSLPQNVFFPALQQFDTLPDGPFVYWSNPDALRAFASLPPLKEAAGDVRQGLATADDPRFARAIWEAPYSDRRYGSNGRAWVPYVKAGASQPWFSPITLLVNWGGEAAELWSNLNSQGKVRSNIWMLREAIRLHFFNPGFSWTRRAVRFIPYVIPAGCIPSASRYLAYPHEDKVFSLIGVAGSNIASVFLRFYGEKFHFPNYMVETVKLLPWPNLKPATVLRLKEHVENEVKRRRRAYQNHEPFHEFTLPLKLWSSGTTPAALEFSLSSILDRDLENDVADAFSLTSQDIESVSLDLREAIACRTSSDAEQEEDDSDFVVDCSDKAQTRALISYLVGCTFGRWDIRYATGERPTPELPGPFEPLQVCSPGMLQGDDGLPLSPEVGRRLRTEGRYPLDVAWDGILVDDPEHPLDLGRRVHASLAVLQGGSNAAGASADAREEEACALLDVPTLREWFRRPAAFFADHLKRYSKSRRQAPIYWPLSAAAGSYTLWLYYHRFHKDTFYRCLELVREKLQHEEARLARLTAAFGANPDARQRKDLEAQEGFVGDIRGFHDEVARVAPLWGPDLNDGVTINYAPLWRLIAHKPWQKAVKACWDELVLGHYDWAHLAIRFWPERVIPKCATDRSLAIAHGLEDVFWVESTDGKWNARKTPTRSVDELIRERTSPAVQAALKSLLEAPPLAGNVGRGRSGQRRTAAVAPAGQEA